MTDRNHNPATPSPHDVCYEALAEKLEHIATILSQGNGRRSQLYDEVIAMVERHLFQIALERNQHVKSRAADYLGINRNTFHKKMIKLGIENHEV
jgi:DNA-binding protein Fis